jgi:hypothetical protein
MVIFNPDSTEMTGHPVSVSQIFEFRNRFLADPLTLRTAGVKGASGRWIERTRDIPF